MIRVESFSYVLLIQLQFVRGFHSFLYSEWDKKRFYVKHEYLHENQF
jgi:hypothetical protein